MTYWLYATGVNNASAWEEMPDRQHAPERWRIEFAEDTTAQIQEMNRHGLNGLR